MEKRPGVERRGVLAALSAAVLSSALCPAAAWAAEPVRIADLKETLIPFGLTVGLVVLGALAILVFNALFISIAARKMELKGSSLSALKAAFCGGVLLLVLLATAGVVAMYMFPNQPIPELICLGIGAGIGLLAGSVAIKKVYECGFVKALTTAAVAGLLALGASTVLVAVLVALKVQF